MMDRPGDMVDEDDDDAGDGWTAELGVEVWEDTGVVATIPPGAAGWWNLL